MNTPSSPPQKPHQLQHHPSPTFSTTSSTVSTSFRSSERGILLRTISEKSHTLSNCQTTLLSPLEAMAEQLTAQKTIIHEALKHNKDEHLELLKEQEEMKAGMGVSIKTFKDQVIVLSQHKKVLVREVHSIRASLLESKQGMDLYRFALQGVELTLSNEANSDRVSRTQIQAVERAKQLGLMRLSRKRDELNRLTKEIEHAATKFQTIQTLVNVLERRVSNNEMKNQKETEDNSNNSMNGKGESDQSRRRSITHGAVSNGTRTRRRSTPKTESWARRRISRVKQKFSPQKNNSSSNNNNNNDSTTDKPSDDELMHQICECLAEEMILDEKLDQLIAVSSHDDDVLGPIMTLSKTMDSTNPDLEIVKNMCIECCQLLSINSKQLKLNYNSNFGTKNLNSKDYAKECAERTSNAWLRLYPTRSLPPGLSIFIAGARDNGNHQRIRSGTSW